jgi:hypothetical protein
VAEIAEIVTSRDASKTRVRELLLEEAEAGYVEVLIIGIVDSSHYKVVGSEIGSHLTTVGMLEYAKRDVMAANTPGAV